jgi:glycosyltransferase involved in cell wall biosynthesis
MAYYYSSSKNKKIHVLHGFVNYGTQSGILARMLRLNGFIAKSITYEDAFKRDTDLIISNSITVIDKLINRPLRLIQRLWWFYKYDVFHFYFGASLLPLHLDFYLYRFFGKRVVCHYLGNEVQGYWYSVRKYKWTNMPGYIGDADPEVYDLRIKERLKVESKYADLQIVCAPVLSEFVENSRVLPLAVDLDRFAFVPKIVNELPCIMHAPTNRGFKGTDHIIQAVNLLKKEGYVFDFKLVEGVTHSMLLEEYKSCDVFIDQIMGGWYGTAAIEAMSIGRPVICSIRREYYSYIDYGEKLPLIDADPDTIYNVIKYVLDNKTEWPSWGLKSRRFVEEVHSSTVVVEKLKNIYNNIGICAE